ncbi:hypothetical protein CF98_24550 [Halopseudomonas bauzanensis]|nr:hypothetical protein CF98_24550 [Halopseudomonas bauzanensis]
MPITFSGLVSAVAASYTLGKKAYDWMADTQLKADFRAYLSDLETRRVLYEEWRYEDMGAVQASLSEILRRTRDLRGGHLSNPQVNSLLRSLITVIQQESDIMRGCNMQSQQGEFMAYKALIKIRTELAKVLAIFCGMLGVDPKSSELSKFIMDMAVVRPRA